MTLNNTESDFVRKAYCEYAIVMADIVVQQNKHASKIAFLQLDCLKDIAHRMTLTNNNLLAELTKHELIATLDVLNLLYDGSSELEKIIKSKIEQKIQNME